MHGWAIPQDNIISYHMVARVIRRNNLTLKNLYHPRHTCITLDYVSGNTGVPRVKQVFSGQIISPYHPGNHVITDNIILWNSPSMHSMNKCNNLTLKNLYHPRHTCITLDYVSGNTGVPRVKQVFSGQIFLRITLATM